MIFSDKKTFASLIFLTKLLTVLFPTALRAATAAKLVTPGILPSASSVLLL